jgi:inorganic triphosphatase YgiF
MGVETELKVRLPTHQMKMLARLQIPGAIGERSEHDLVSTNFDTPNHKLKRHGLSLRVRQVGAKHIQTIKTSPWSAVRLWRMKNRNEDLARSEAIEMASDPPPFQ